MNNLGKVDLSNAKVGDKVFNIMIMEWEEILDIRENNDYPIVVETNRYSASGKLFEIHKTAVIYPYNPFEPKKVLVRDDDGDPWSNAIYIGMYKNRFHVLEHFNGFSSWNQMKEITKTEVSLDELIQAYAKQKNIDVSEIEIKD
jgi:hypothetical protein